ncbi:hypothetical protein NDU88_005683 [Pleurodeles waltl]|uniref:Uncharacterized protein n=1 Tax=Pleurodeles waltl TaxID=8319 RepID=A0AAV7SMK2_PLEWA|nr:hypothetical protein NDU88_005683 [Pleurodeles waltl]
MEEYIFHVFHGIAGDRHTPVRKQAILLHHLGAEGRRIYDDLPEIPLGTGDGQPTNVYEMSLLMLEKHFTPKLNTVFERHKFFSCAQGQDEDIMSFVATRRGLAVTCDFRDLSDSLIRDQIVRCTNNIESERKVIINGPYVGGKHTSSQEYGTHGYLDEGDRKVQRTNKRC